MCHGTEDKTLEKRPQADAPVAEEPSPWLNRGFLGRLVKVSPSFREQICLFLCGPDMFCNTTAHPTLPIRTRRERRHSQLAIPLRTRPRNSAEGCFSPGTTSLPTHGSHSLKTPTKLP